MPCSIGLPFGSREVDQAQLPDVHRCYGSRCFVTAFDDDLLIIVSDTEGWRGAGINNSVLHKGRLSHARS